MLSVEIVRSSIIDTARLEGVAVPVITDQLCQSFIDNAEKSVKDSFKASADYHFVTADEDFLEAISLSLFSQIDSLLGVA